MRRQVLRPSMMTLLAALLLNTTAVVAVRAQEAVSTALPAAPPVPSPEEVFAPLVAQRVAVPTPPAGDPGIPDPDDVVGTIPSAPAPAPKARAPVSAALTFEEGRSAPRSAPLLAGLPGPDRQDTLIPAAVAPATGAPAVEPTPVAVPGVAVPPVLAPAATATPPAGQPETAPALAGPPASPPALAQQPPAADPAMPAAVLAGFAGQAVPGDTPAQATERRRTREAIAAYYTSRGRGPLWIVEGRYTAAARAAQARIDRAAQDGLDLARYPVPPARGTDVAALAGTDLLFSEAVVAYGRQAGGSRVDPARFGGAVDLRPDVAGVDRVLDTVAAAPDAGEALRAFNPPQPGYAALRDKLAELRQSSPAVAQSRIPSGPVLKPGMKDARVPLIRARFGLDVARVDPDVPELVYDTRVAAAVADFQRAHGLPASGQLTPRTVAALSGGNPARLENSIVANMELWRWMPRDIAADRVDVNIPDYTAKVVRGGAVVHQTRVVVGQPDKPTPVFAEQMRFIIVNPYWNVPLSIIKNEMMPKLATDPNYFANHGYEVVERNGIRYIRQPPGEGNALGRIKFMFPNSHSVYLHDTNARSFFARDMRALSHGCVRVEQPFSFAEAVLGAENGWTEGRVKKLIGGKERTITLPRPLPILITYFTAFVDPQTGFQLRDDVYGYAGRVKTALNLQD